MSKKNKKILIISAVIIAVCLAIYYAYTLSSTTTYPYTDENGITYFEDGSYSYINGPNIVTQHPDGLTTVTSNPDYVSDFVPTGVVNNIPAITNAGNVVAGGNIAVNFGG